MADRRPLVTEIGEGLKFVVGHPLLRRLIACTGLGNLTFSAITALEVLYMVDTLHFSPVTIGVMEMVGAAGGLVAAVLTTKLAKSIGEGLTIIAHGHRVPDLRVCLATVVGAAPGPDADGRVAAPLHQRRRLQHLHRQLSAAVVPTGAVGPDERFRPVPGVGVDAHRRPHRRRPGTHLGIVPTFWIASFAGLFSLLPIYFSPLWRMFTLPDAKPTTTPPRVTTELDEDRPTVPEA